MTFDVIANLVGNSAETRHGRVKPGARGELKNYRFSRWAQRDRWAKSKYVLKVVKTTIPGEDPLRVSKLGKEHPELGLAG